MPDYMLTFHHLGDGRDIVRHVTAEPDGLAQAVHQHARGYLGSDRVTVHLDPATLTGTVTSHGTHTGRFTIEATESAAAETEPAGPLHGYTLHAIDRLVRTGLQRNPWYAACDADERYAAGWHAAVELLCTTVEPPAPRDIIQAAWRGADALTNHDMQHRGIPRARGTSYTGRTDVPHFHAYWNTVARHAASPEEPVVERVALAQIWPRLAPRFQAALLALAVHGDYQAAADSLGLRRATFYAQIRHARNAVLALWWEDETPRRGWRDVRRTTEPTQQHTISAHLRKRRRSGAAAS